MFQNNGVGLEAIIHDARGLVQMVTSKFIPISLPLECAESRVTSFGIEVDRKIEIRSVTLESDCLALI